MLIDEGWSKADADSYKKFLSGITMTSPAEAANSYAQSVLKADRSIGGLIMEFNDPRLPVTPKTEGANSK
jgi:hypothetical protein